MFSSDNGLHTGEYRLMPGKLTAFDTDIHVPLVVVGPGVPADAGTDAMAENIDLAKTFARSPARPCPATGTACCRCCAAQPPPDWRNAVADRAHGPHDLGARPGLPAAAPAATRPATRRCGPHSFLYVEYTDGEREFYDLRTDPFELHNIAPFTAPAVMHQLHLELLAIKNCHTGASCWAAMHVPPLASSLRRHHRHQDRHP